jgi:hypothetical protein
LSSCELRTNLFVKSFPDAEPASPSPVADIRSLKVDVAFEIRSGGETSNGASLKVSGSGPELSSSEAR